MDNRRVFTPDEIACFRAAGRGAYGRTPPPPQDALSGSQRQVRGPFSPLSPEIATELRQPYSNPQWEPPPQRIPTRELLLHIIRTTDEILLHLINNQVFSRRPEDYPPPLPPPSYEEAMGLPPVWDPRYCRPSRPTPLELIDNVPPPRLFPTTVSAVRPHLVLYGAIQHDHVPNQTSDNDSNATL